LDTGIRQKEGIVPVRTSNRSNAEEGQQDLKTIPLGMIGTSRYIAKVAALSPPIDLATYTERR